MLEQSAAVGVSKTELMAQIPFRLCSADDCARQILRGVLRNRGVIAFPFYVRFLTFLHRFFPRISEMLVRQMTRQFRKVRQAPAELTSAERN
jgi:hypothetical protein